MVGAGATRDLEPELGVTFGFDWLTPAGFHVLASGGPGVASFGDERLDWQAYLGLQWDFEIWGTD